MVFRPMFSDMVVLTIKSREALHQCTGEMDCSDCAMNHPDHGCILYIIDETFDYQNRGNVEEIKKLCPGIRIG